MADQITIPNEGKKYFVDVATHKRTAEDIKLGLFVNDATISATTTKADLTSITTHGISEITLAGSEWPSATIDGSGRGVSQHPAVNFTAGTADDGTTTNVYGYYAIAATNGDLLWVVKFGASKPITYENDQITVVPELTTEQVSA